MTAETASNEPEQASADHRIVGIARNHLIAAAVFLLLGLVVATIAAFQLVLPDLLSGVAATTYGKLAPAARILLAGWVMVGLLGGGYFALGRITGTDTTRSVFALGSLVLISLGTVGGAAMVILGFGTGFLGLASPLPARAVIALGCVLAAVVSTALARSSKDRLGAAGWYLASAPLWLAISSVAGLIPIFDGVPGAIQVAFLDATFTGLFVLTASVGLLYFVLTSIAGVDVTAPRPLSALGFWSLTLVWANMGAVQLIYSPTPDWYETLTIAFAIASIIPLLTITVDLGLIVRGRVGAIADRASLRYVVIAGLTLASATIVNLLLAWRATSAVAQFSLLVDGLDILIVVGGASFAIFAVHSVAQGGSAGPPSFHLVVTVIGLLVAGGSLVVGGVIVAFNWAAGPAGEAYANAGEGWKVTADGSAPFLWVAAVGLAIVTLGQILYLATIGRRSEDELSAPTIEVDYELDFEGEPRYASWGRLVTGVVLIWFIAALLTAVLPMVDPTDGDSTILADTSRTYAAGTPEASGRDLYISEGCIACHTQQVRPVGTDVGLGAVSLSGDYANENPAPLGLHRFGPDLTHVATRGDALDPALVAVHLEDPRSLIPWSTMPSYSYLSDDDITDLVAYIETLR